MTPLPHAIAMADIPAAWLVLSDISYNIVFPVPTTPKQIKVSGNNKWQYSKWFPAKLL